MSWYGIRRIDCGSVEEIPLTLPSPPCAGERVLLPYGR